MIDPDEIRERAIGSMYEPEFRELADEIELLRALATEALELTKYAAAAFAYTEAGSGTPEWFEGLREQLETLQPNLMDAVTPNS